MASATGVRVALIGYGLGGRYFHAPIIAATSGLRLDFVVTSSAERAGEARAEHSHVRVVASAEALWEHAHAIDLVVISTPNRTHVPLAAAALDAGLNVVVDKPIAPSSAEARRLVELARGRGRLLSVYQNRRWDGDFLTMRRLLDEQAVGVVHRFESRFERWRPVPRGGWRDSGALEEAGGLLFDIGTHLIDQALVLFGPVAHVYAELGRVRKDVRVDDDVFLALTHASGVHSHLWTTLVAAQQGPRFRLLGSRGTYTKRGMDVQEDALRRGERPGGDDWGVEPSDHWGVLALGDESRTIHSERGSYQSFYAGIVQSLRTDAPPPVDAGEAIATLEIIEAARRFVQTRADGTEFSFGRA